MHRELLILVCHDTDGHFADGNRHTVRHLLEHAGYIATFQPRDTQQYLLACHDGGQVIVRAPGLDGTRTFHRIELYLNAESWTPDLFALVYDLMLHGGFGLMDGIQVQQFIVTQPQQISYFPWLPQPPILVRSVHDLEQVLV